MKRLYTAGKLTAAPIFREYRKKYADRIEFTSRWIDSEFFDDDKFHMGVKTRGWVIDHVDVVKSDALLIFGNLNDELRGALVEAGIAIALNRPVLACGFSKSFGTWQYHPNVLRFPTIDCALETWLESDSAMGVFQ